MPIASRRSIDGCRTTAVRADRRGGLLGPRDGRASSTAGGMPDHVHWLGLARISRSSVGRTPCGRSSPVRRSRIRRDVPGPSRWFAWQTGYGGASSIELSRTLRGRAVNRLVRRNITGLDDRSRIDRRWRSCDGIMSASDDRLHRQRLPTARSNGLLPRCRPERRPVHGRSPTLDRTSDDAPTRPVPSPDEIGNAD